MFIHKFGNYREVHTYQNGKLCIYRRGADNKLHLEIEIEMSEEQAKKIKEIMAKDHSEKPYLFKLPRRQVKRKLKLKGWAMSLKNKILFEVVNPNYGKD